SLNVRSGGCGRTGTAGAGAPLRARGAPGGGEVRGAGAARTPPPSTEALRGVVLLARRPPPPSMEPLRGAVFSARLTLSPGGDGSPAFRLDHGCGELTGAAGVGQPEGERPVHVAELGDRPVVAPLGAADLVHAAVLATGPVAVEQLDVGELAALPQRVVAVDHQDPQRAGGVEIGRA